MEVDLSLYIMNLYKSFDVFPLIIEILTNNVFLVFLSADGRVPKATCTHERSGQSGGACDAAHPGWQDQTFSCDGL